MFLFSFFFGFFLYMYVLALRIKSSLFHKSLKLFRVQFDKQYNMLIINKTLNGSLNLLK